MKTVFADIYYYLALLNPADEGHDRAVEYTSNSNDVIVMTTWVLAEVGNGLSSRKRRGSFVGLIQELESNRNARVIPANQRLFDRGVRLYRERPDKDWSLTDCISFVVMRDLRLRDALTDDKHFEQAGFVAMLRSP